MSRIIYTMIIACYNDVQNTHFNYAIIIVQMILDIFELPQNFLND
ncbi:hypothetical protein pb186bvf_011140 [Paramecium bursaria]